MSSWLRYSRPSSNQGKEREMGAGALVGVFPVFRPISDDRKKGRRRRPFYSCWLKWVPAMNSTSIPFNAFDFIVILPGSGLISFPTRLLAPWGQAYMLLTHFSIPNTWYFTLTLWVTDKCWLNWISKVATRSWPWVLQCFRQLDPAWYPPAWMPRAGNLFWIVTLVYFYNFRTLGSTVMLESNMI